MPDVGANPNIPSKAEKKRMKDAYQGRGKPFSANRLLGPRVTGAGGTQAKDRGDRQYAATGQRQPEGEKPGLLDRWRQRNAERDQEAQQRQYARDLAQQKQNDKRVAQMAKGGLGRRMAVGALGKLAGGGAGNVMGEKFSALAKSGEGINRGLGRMGEREAAMQRLNDKKRSEARKAAWKNLKKGDFKGAWDKMRKRPKKQQDVKTQDHSKLMWGFLIGLAFVKDMIDIGTLTLASWITWVIAVTWGFSMFFFLGRKKNVEFVEKIVKSLGPSFVEFVPFLNFIPVLTFSVLYIWYRSEIMTQLPGKPEEKKLPG